MWQSPNELIGPPGSYVTAVKFIEMTQDVLFQNRTPRLPKIALTSILSIMRAKDSEQIYSGSN